MNTGKNSPAGVCRKFQEDSLLRFATTQYVFIATKGEVGLVCSRFGINGLWLVEQINCSLVHLSTDSLRVEPCDWARCVNVEARSLLPLLGHSLTQSRKLLFLSWKLNTNLDCIQCIVYIFIFTSAPIRDKPWLMKWSLIFQWNIRVSQRIPEQGTGHWIQAWSPLEVNTSEYQDHHWNFGRKTLVETWTPNAI